MLGRLRSRRREERDDSAAKSVKPAPDGPPEMEDAARQETEYPEDETNEG